MASDELELSALRGGVPTIQPILGAIVVALTLARVTVRGVTQTIPEHLADIVSVADLLGIAQDTLAAVNERVLAGNTPVVDRDYQCLPTDVQVSYQSLSTGRVVSLPDAEAYPFGQDLVIWDVSGSCSPAIPLTIRPSPGSNDIIAAAENSLLLIEQPYFPVRMRRGAANLWVRMP